MVTVRPLKTLINLVITFITVPCENELNFNVRFAMKYLVVVEERKLAK